MYYLPFLFDSLFSKTAWEFALMDMSKSHRLDEVWFLFSTSFFCHEPFGLTWIWSAFARSTAGWAHSVLLIVMSWISEILGNDHSTDVTVQALSERLHCIWWYLKDDSFLIFSILPWKFSAVLRCLVDCQLFLKNPYCKFFFSGVKNRRFCPDITKNGRTPVNCLNVESHWS